MSTVDMLKGYFAKKVGKTIAWNVQKERGDTSSYRIEVIGLDGDVLHAGMEYQALHSAFMTQAGDFQVKLREGITREHVLNMLSVACDPYFLRENLYLHPEIQDAIDDLAIKDNKVARPEPDEIECMPNPFPLSEPEGERLSMLGWMERDFRDANGRDRLTDVKRDYPADPDSWLYSAWAEKDPVRRIRMLDASARLAWTYARDLSGDFYYQPGQARTFTAALQLRFPSLLQVGRIEEAMETARALMAYDARRTWGRIFFGVSAVLSDDKKALAKAGDLLDRNDDALGAWPWARLLVLAASDADNKELAQAAQDAMLANKYVPEFLDGEDIDPTSIRNLSGAFGSPAEAVVTASYMQKAWKKLGMASEIVERALPNSRPSRSI